MSWRPSRFNPYLVLFFLTLAFRVLTAIPLEQSGYMDASYAVHIAENLARGRGFTEDVLWNFLDQPAALPHPSNLYWMPLQSILIAPFFQLLGVSYHAAQIPYIFLSAFLPLVAFHLGRKIFQKDDMAWAAGLFTLFSGFYTIYWVSPDSFTSFALFASLCLYFVARGVVENSKNSFFLAGILAALSHLARADGVLLLAVIPIALYFKSSRNLMYILRFSLYGLVGYLLLMAPWFARNYLTLGTLYPSVGTKSLWLVNYDELFRYADDLTPERYLATGFGSILQPKLIVAIYNLIVILGSPIAPFAVIGLWQLRRRVELFPFFIYTAMLYLALTIAFTFPSRHNSILHSASALTPFLAVAAPAGIDAAVAWVARRRRAWNAVQASRFFRIGFIGIAAIFSLYTWEGSTFGLTDRAGDYLRAQLGIATQGSTNVLWNLRDSHYAPIAQWLDQHAHTEDVVMVVDAPAFYNVSHRRAIMIPTDEDRAAIFQAAQKFGARYLILEFDHPTPLSNLYLQRAEVPGLEPVANFRDALGRPVTLFQVTAK